MLLSVILHAVMVAIRSLSSFLYGLILTAGAIALSAALAFWGFHNSYYLGALLPVFMAVFILLSWLVHLKSTGLFGAALRPREIVRDPRTGAEVTGIRDDNGLLRRRPVRGETEDNEGRVMRVTVAALVWSALQLAVLSTALYHFAGVGASF